MRRERAGRGVVGGRKVKGAYDAILKLYDIFFAAGGGWGGWGCRV